MNVSLLTPVTSVASAVGDPGRTRLVLGSIVALIAIGVLLAGAAVWLYRTTRHDHPVLAPLELMGDRSWRRADPATRRSLLDEHRPAGATPAVSPLAEPPPQPADDVDPIPADPTAGIEASSGNGDVASDGDGPVDDGDGPVDDGAEPTERQQIEAESESR